MKRCIFNIAAGLSLLLAIGVTFEWVRGWWWIDAIGAETAVGTDGRQSGLSCNSACGSVECYFWTRQYLTGIPKEARRSATYYYNRVGDRTLMRQTREAQFSNLGATEFLGFGVAFREMDAGFARSDGASGPGPYSPQKLWALEIPHWALSLLAGMLPTIWLIRHRRSVQRGRRAALGLCPDCGYDLRASAGRCPECGAHARQLIAEPNPAMD